MIILKNKERVIRALDDDLRKPLSAFVEAEFKGQGVSREPASYFTMRNGRQKDEFKAPIAQWAVRMLLRFILASWKDVDWKLDRSLIEDVRDWANRSHYANEDLLDAETKTALQLIHFLVRIVSPAPGPKVERIFKKHLEEERNRADWQEGDWHIWPADLNSGWPGLPEGRVGFVSSSGPWAPDGSYVGVAGSHEGVCLYVLPLDRPYRSISGNPAETTAAKILEAIRYPNSVMFLAVDDGAVKDLRESICHHRAWESTEEQIMDARDDFMPHEQEGARASFEQAHRLGMDRIRAGYRWLLIPMRSNPERPLRWSVVQLDDSPDPIHGAWEQLEKAGAVVTRLEPIRLAEMLARVPLWEVSSHVLTSKLALECARRLHLPRLKNWNVLYATIAESLGTPDCPFAFALCNECLTGDEQVHNWKPIEKPSASLLRAGCLVKRQTMGS